MCCHLFDKSPEVGNEPLLADGAPVFDVDDGNEILLFGVNSDELVQSYKGKCPVIPQEERAEIVRNIKAVDECVIVSTLDKTEILKNFRFDAVFIGDDWKGNARWEQTEADLKPFHVDVVYLPHTDGISSTQLRPSEGEKVEE